jgi:hypothetical protein
MSNIIGAGNLIGRDGRCRTVQKLALLQVTASDCPEHHSHVVLQAIVQALIIERRHGFAQVRMMHLHGTEHSFSVCTWQTPQSICGKQKYVFINVMPIRGTRQLMRVMSAVVNHLA